MVKLLLDWGGVSEDSTVRLATHIAFATEDTRAGRDGNEDRQFITLLDDAPEKWGEIMSSLNSKFNNPTIQVLCGSEKIRTIHMR